VATVAIIQARMTSTRLPGKVLLPLGTGTILDAVVARVAAAQGIDRICVAIPEGPEHDQIAASVGALPTIAVARGSERDVLSRFLVAARLTDAEAIVRVTSDCPLIDPAVVGTVIAAARCAGVPYASTALETGYPTGYDVEVVTRDALEAAGREAEDAYEREHVTPYIWRRPDRFRALYIDHKPDLRPLRLVVDTREDYEMARQVWARLGADPLFGLHDVLELRRREPALFAMNAMVRQKPYEGLSQT
jgi:spore coat polysaccharide biosynthesis protein SpsF (cytidylyltransferase family)